MRILFEELPKRKRLGGIESSTSSLSKSLRMHGVKVVRSHQKTGRHPGFDCVHFHGIWSPRLASKLLRAACLGIPTVTTLHGMLDAWCLSHKAVKKKIALRLYQKRLLNLTTIIHTTSPVEKIQCRNLGISSAVVNIPWGVDLPALHKRISERRIRTVLFLSRIHPIKGLPLLVEAWSKVSTGGWKVKIAGPDQDGHLEQLKRMIKDRNLESDFEFCGELRGTEKAQAYREADLFILPTLSENFGLVIAEALSYGLPVLTTQAAPWNRISEVGAGWWTQPSVSGLVEALAEALSLPRDQLQAMGEAGRKLVATEFTWAQCAIDFSQLYEKCIEGQSPSNITS